MGSSLKKKKLLKKNFDGNRTLDFEQIAIAGENIRRYDYYVNEKCYQLPEGFEKNKCSFLKIYGIKNIPIDDHSLYPRIKNYNAFDNFKVSEFFAKLTGWYAMYLNGGIENPLVYTPVYDGDNFKIQCAIGHTRLELKYAAGDIINFSERLEYPAYYYDFGNADFNKLESILGKDNLKEVKNVEPEYVRSSGVAYHPVFNNTLRLIAPFQTEDWINGYKLHQKRFWYDIENNEYEPQFYRNGELQFHIKLNKKPLRINLDHEGILSKIGLCQATLWFFFGIDTWPNDKKYFSVGSDG
jgi:hypothetical protein